MTKAMTTSCQPRPQPHMTGTAATTAASGTTMNAASITCSMRARRRVLGTEASGPTTAPVTGDAEGGRTRAVVGAVIRVVLLVVGPRRTYGSVTYATVGSTRRRR